MPRHRRECSKNCRKRHAAQSIHFWNFARYALEVFLLLFLLFALPHVVNGIANTPAVGGSEQIIGDGSSNQAQFIYNEPHFLPDRTGIVELFEWKFVDVGIECTNFLGPKGYAGVQLSPVTEHLLEGVQAQSWLARYRPISYKFATRSGSMEDFIAMSRACNAAGLRVFVDVVLNHMVGDPDGSVDTVLVGTAGSVANVTTLDYSGVPFDASDFHEPCVIENFSDAYEVRNCQQDGQPDLDHSRVTVRERIVEFLNQLIEMGVAGFRVDAAKYMWPMDLKVIYDATNDLNSAEFGFEPNSRPFFYQEVVDLGMDAISKTEYAANGVVTEYLYAAELSTIFKGKVPLSSLINWGPAMGFLQHQDALVFVDSHESQHGTLERELGKNKLLSYQKQSRYVMATAFMLAHPYGRIKRILSSYHFPVSDKQSGPPTEATTENSNELPNILSPEFDSNDQCTPATGWVCEHRWPVVVNMVAFANALSATEDGIIDFQTYGPNHIAFCRGQKAFIAFNNDVAVDYETTVRTCLEPGIYCDVVSGGRKPDDSDCFGKRIVVKENGDVDLMLAALDATQSDVTDNNEDDAGEWDGPSVTVDYGVIAIYVGSKLVNSQDTIQPGVVVEENELETDLKSQGAEAESNTEIGEDQIETEPTDGTTLVFEATDETDDGTLANTTDTREEIGDMKFEDGATPSAMK